MARRPKVLIWHRCYEEQWHGHILKQSFRHPAKFAKGLVDRIILHGLEQGYWKPNDRIGDPFGGVATGGIRCAYHGLQWFGLELEPQFVDLGSANIEHHRSRLVSFGRPVPVLRQGDSRFFAERIHASITSPPFGDANAGRGIAIEGYVGEHRGEPDVASRTFQGKAGDRVASNIEKLTQGTVEAAITSPPYIDTHRKQQDGIDWDKAAREGKGGGEHQARGASLHATYGDAQENIGHLGAGSVDAAITSPPYADIATGQGGLNHKPARQPGEQSGRTKEGGTQDVDPRYGDTPGQIGKLNGAVTSPPWEKNVEGGRSAHKMTAKALLNGKRGKGASDAAVLAQAERDAGKTYGESEGQIGKEAGETYWQAIAKVYASLFASLKPGGVAAIVVKDYVKRKARVPLCDDTMRLLEHVGFVELERARAMLVREEEHAGLFGAITEKKERKSFFKRLHEGKGGTRIDWEEVLFVRKPAETGQHTVSNPQP